jgi:ABC-type nitrate/sulfonate/bicarbonate transport system permease component
MRKQRKRFYHFYLGREPGHWFGVGLGLLVILLFTCGLLAVGRLSGVDLGRLLNGLVISFGRVTLAYVISLLLGVIIAILVTRSKSIENLLLPIFETGQSLPTVAILPLVVLWLGSEHTIIFLLVITIIWPVVFSVVSGFKNIPTSLNEAALVYGACGIKKFLNFTFPLLLPSVITGSVIGWGEGWEVLIAAELLGAKQGLGTSIGEAAHAAQNTIMIVAIAFLMFIIFLLNKWVWIPLLRRATQHQI